MGDISWVLFVCYGVNILVDTIFSLTYWSREEEGNRYPPLLKTSWIENLSDSIPKKGIMLFFDFMVTPSSFSKWFESSFVIKLSAH